MEEEEGKAVNIWKVYFGCEKHDRLGDMSGKGYVLLVEDFKAWSKRGDGEKGRRNKEGKLVEDWMDEWELKLENVGGVHTRYDERSRVGRVLDLAVYGGGVSLKCEVEKGIVELDYGPLEVEVEVEKGKIGELDWKKGKVDWGKCEGELRVWGGMGIWMKEGKVRREHVK